MPLPLTPLSKLSYFSCIRVTFYCSLGVEHHSCDCGRKHEGLSHAQKDNHGIVSMHLSSSLPHASENLPALDLPLGGI